ncbi:hypothetical protein [Brachybacterium sp. UNK5269]|uniref:hypothetical protein n=1 Tax=Brachybacterium sp. UNK5269 TaxID=3408576 RepID=UPI003BB208A2
MHEPGEQAPVAPATAGGDPGRALPGRPASRRRLLQGACALAAVAAVGTGGVTAQRLLRPAVDPRTVIPLYSGTVAYDAAGRRTLVAAGDAALSLVPGSRLALDLPAASPVRERAQGFAGGSAAWRDRVAAVLAADPVLVDLADSALADLWVLTDDLPAPVAGWSPRWQYVWPRDASFGAVALARIGHLDRAVAALEHLQGLQAGDGWFEARFLPGTDRAPDRRGRQFDGTGLLLWAASEVIACAPAARRDELRERLRPLIGTSLSALLGATRGGAGLPPVSPDYWEVRESSVTLGIMAATLAGLRAGAHLTGRAAAQEAAETFTVLLAGTFGASGHQRYRGGGGADSARAFFDATGGHGVVPLPSLRALRHELARPAGGIAPGAAWREDGISWTPSTSLLALALARAGDRGAAQELLHWLAAHRTAAGSLPEKVLFDGSPAAVAPLSWTAANVLITLDVLASG